MATFWLIAQVDSFPDCRHMKLPQFATLSNTVSELATGVSSIVISTKSIF